MESETGLGVEKLYARAAGRQNGRTAESGCLLASKAEGVL